MSVADSYRLLSHDLEASGIAPTLETVEEATERIAKDLARKEVIT